MPKKSGKLDHFELDITFDRVGGEYPAWVTETFLAEQGSLSTSSASLGHGHCWFVSKQQLFVWKYQESKRRQTMGNKRFAKMALPPTGLGYSANCVVVYKNGSNAGALAVSCEGVASHWSNITNLRHSQMDLDLSSQVVLSVQLLEQPIGEKPPTFLLTTTSGSIFYLRPKAGDQGHGSMEVQKIAGSSPAIRSSIIEKDFAEDGMEWNKRFSVVVAPKLLTLFDIEKRSLLWTIHVEQFFQESITEAIKVFTRETSITGVRLWMLDAVEFRDSLLCLLGATCNERHGTVLFFLATLDNYEIEPDEVAWCSAVIYPSETVRYEEEEEFVGKVSLLVPGNTAKSRKNDGTDGVLILHPNFANVVYVPDVVSNVHAPVVFSKTDFFTHNDRLVGHAVDDQYSYVMLTSTGIATVRLLPRGFDDAILNEENCQELMNEILPNGAENMHKLTAAFVQFGEKDIAAAQNSVQFLRKMTDQELAQLIYSFLEHCVNYYDDGEHRLELILRVKRLYVQRLILFLKQFGIYDKICSIQLHVGVSTKLRSMTSILAEASEKIATAISLLDWMRLNTDNSDAVKMALEKMNKARNNNRIYPSTTIIRDIEQEAIGRISSICLLPIGIVQSVKDIFKKGTYTVAQKLEVLHIAVEMLLKYSASIETSRRCSASVATQQGEALWTHGGISDAFSDMCRIILELLVQPIGHSEQSRLREFILRLIVFHLNELTERPDGNEALIGIYNAGDQKAALDLAQRFKDFKILIKDVLKLPEKERSEALAFYKKRYAEDDFEIYYCSYLRKHGYNELLLAESGERVDRYLATCEDIRWRRELQNNNYEKASHSLLSLAEKEKSDVWKCKALTSLSKLSALCSDKPINVIVDEADRKLNLINHQMKIPGTLIRKVFTDNPNRPLTINELLQVNLMAGDLEESDEEMLEGHIRALQLVASLLTPQSEEQVVEIANDVWISVWRSTNWKAIKTKHDEAISHFGQVIVSLVADEDIPLKQKLILMPRIEKITQSICKEGGGARKSIVTNTIDGEDVIKRLCEIMRLKLEEQDDQPMITE
ncbi:hypothetical protein WR25_13362 [Diploscapter pachys]|uniref:Nucleoporin Nup133/Nup155-like C-terminal domain-containing protein n=1 Tax=Diploscapter pachys TaxID=2018661 RepID=A0A2A2KMG7_9BILA|nr:hypothetical protein WR25_13362 [Diploscapter pachys]